MESKTLAATIERAMEQRRLQIVRIPVREPIDAEKAYGIMGTNAVMWKVYKVIETVAANIHPVLILGESGTGKELVARAIRFSGVRHERLFLPVGCGTLVPHSWRASCLAMREVRSPEQNRPKMGCSKLPRAEAHSLMK